MLHLAAPTRPEWATEALLHLPTVLMDHAHCEKKAASTAINLIFRYVDRTELVAPLSALAREELLHFEQVLELLAARGMPFGRLEPSPYAGRLMAAARKEEPHRLLDTLLCCALIEARSTERMMLLGEVLRPVDPELADLYDGLLKSEARHFATYVDLARRLYPADEVSTRLTELAAHEARVLESPGAEPRLHA
jgi:tRNA 2-(methylsulfanyl)-N6-isopentenyladenosine37 hydroxylase